MFIMFNLILLDVNHSAGSGHPERIADFGMMLMFLMGTHASGNTLVLFVMIRPYRMFARELLGLPLRACIGGINKIRNILGFSSSLRLPTVRALPDIRFQDVEVGGPYGPQLDSGTGVHCLVAHFNKYICMQQQ